MNETHLRLFKQNYFELGEAFKGLADGSVWKRPAPNLLSVGEIAGHMTHWEALRLAGDGKSTESCVISSPLIDRRFRYYTTSLEDEPSSEHLTMTGEQVYQEMLRVHEAGMAHFTSLKLDLESAPDTLPDWSYGSQIEYLLFHLAYHTGQIYMTRHLLGETTVDN